MKTDKAYERTYGWSWFLKLHQELKGLGELDKVINMMLTSFFKCIKVSFLGNLPLRFILLFQTICLCRGIRTRQQSDLSIFFNFELERIKYFQDHAWSFNLQPIADHFIQAYMDFLPKLIYPVRVGEHSNSAFGLIFPYEYAIGN